jgi:hypothetical protein
LDDVDCSGKFPAQNDEDVGEDGFGTPYEDISDDEHDSFEEG